MFLHQLRKHAHALKCSTRVFYPDFEGGNPNIMNF